MTLNGVMGLILRFFSPISIDLQSDYVTVVEDTIMSAKYRLSFPVFPLSAKTSPPCSAVSMR